MLFQSIFFQYACLPSLLHVPQEKHTCRNCLHREKETNTVSFIHYFQKKRIRIYRSYSRSSPLLYDQNGLGGPLSSSSGVDVTAVGDAEVLYLDSNTISFPSFL